ncbi:hypothetical protein L1049_014501 [Liquidambar formosana]|uniref:SKP1-like protein n=1 Tax=Liquidambar formosana TaxID=63359 RepID=A0AAP0X5T6_LIQFO
MSDGNTIKLKSSDGETFEVDEAVAFQSKTIKRKSGNDYSGCKVITLSSVTGNILSMVIKFCENHVQPPFTLSAWDSGFVDVDQSTLFDLIMAAYNLEIESLQNLACKKAADMIKGKTPEEIRKTFNIKKD